jgi:ATP-dependent HslUV protease ATP-binding subunit HslU
VLPKNILMIGTTGVGKTEIARRLARIADSPFIKIEASKFTEVGYVGRDVESMIRELTDVAVDMARQSAYEEVKPRAEENAEERLLDLLLPRRPIPAIHRTEDGVTDAEASSNRTRQKLREQLRRGDLDDRLIEMDTQERPSATIDFVAGQGMEEMA